MAAHLTDFYLHVVADVISNVREDFLSEGIDETILLELQSLWELNMMQKGTIQGGHGDLSYLRSAAHPFPHSYSVHDLNMPYAGETPTAELLFPPTPVHTPMPSFAHMPSPSFAASSTGLQHPVSINAAEIAIGMPAPFMPSPWVNQKPDTNLGMNPKLDMNVAYEGEDEEEPSNGHFLMTKEFFPPIGKRKREVNPSDHSVPQHDGTADLISMTVPLERALRGNEQQHNQSQMEAPTAPDMKRSMGTSIDQHNHIKERISAVGDYFHTTMHYVVPQLDGINDNYDDGVAEEDYNEPGVEEQVAAESAELNDNKPSKSEGGESDSSEPPLNEDDDLDDLDDANEGEEQLQTQHVVYAQFEKVTRAKNKWKCILKDGIMHLNGHDILVSRAMGEFDF